MGGTGVLRKTGAKSATLNRPLVHLIDPLSRHATELLADLREGQALDNSKSKDLLILLFCSHEQSLAISESACQPFV